MKATDIQSEFFVPLKHARAAIRAVRAVAKSWDFSSPYSAADQGETKGLVDAFEFRCVRGDGAWLSPSPVDSFCVHTSFNSDPSRRDEVLRAVRAIEAALAPFGVPRRVPTPSTRVEEACLRSARIGASYRTTPRCRRPSRRRTATGSSAFARCATRMILMGLLGMRTPGVRCGARGNN